MTGLRGSAAGAVCRPVVGLGKGQHVNVKTSPAFLVFSDDWGEHPSSCQHIFKHIARRHQVVWVNTVGLRVPRPTRVDFEKALVKLRKMLSKSDHGPAVGRSDAPLEVLQPFMLPFVKCPGVNTVNRFFVLRAVRGALARAGIESPILVITAPNACDYIGSCGEAKSVYYCVDDFSEWPGLDKGLVRNMEDALVSRADRFIATSQLLYDRIAEHGKEVLLLSHGVDAEFFAEAANGEHALLDRIPKPRVGYFGLFDDRSDLQLLSEVARSLSDISFVITGTVQADVARLRSLGNVYFTGSVPYEELPSLSMGFDICMLPYKINRLTDAIQPLKIKEYLATGKPVISTRLKEAVTLEDYLDIAETAEEWVSCIGERLGGLADEVKSRRAVFLSHESWQAKSRRFLDHCLKE